LNGIATPCKGKPLERILDQFNDIQGLPPTPGVDHLFLQERGPNDSPLYR
jgi:hypothetical protein